jgi:hypothetical protein
MWQRKQIVKGNLICQGGGFNQLFVARTLGFKAHPKAHRDHL